MPDTLSQHCLITITVMARGRRGCSITGRAHARAVTACERAGAQGVSGARGREREGRAARQPERRDTRGADEGRGVGHEGGDKRVRGRAAEPWLQQAREHEAAVLKRAHVRQPARRTSSHWER